MIWKIMKFLSLKRMIKLMLNIGFTPFLWNVLVFSISRTCNLLGFFEKLAQFFRLGPKEFICTFIPSKAVSSWFGFNSLNFTLCFSLTSLMRFLTAIATCKSQSDDVTHSKSPYSQTHLLVLVFCTLCSDFWHFVCKCVKTSCLLLLTKFVTDAASFSAASFSQKRLQFFKFDVAWHVVTYWTSPT